MSSSNDKNNLVSDKKKLKKFNQIPYRIEVIEELTCDKLIDSMIDFKNETTSSDVSTNCDDIRELMPKKYLDFSKARHFVVGYSFQFNQNWNFKLETYYQSLYSIPVSAAGPSSFSLINQEDNYAITALNNMGKGKNYGVELTLERFWNDQFYFLSTLSLYQSKYQASDLIWRNTRFNSNSIFTVTMGKEWNLHTKKTSTFALDLKITNHGGVRVTPINLQQSIIRKTTVLDNTRIYEERLPDIFRIDLQVQWKTQYKKMTGSLIAGVQNLTNRKNPVRQYYDSGIGGIRYNYLLALIPVVGYKIDF